MRVSEAIAGNSDVIVDFIAAEARDSEGRGEEGL